MLPYSCVSSLLLLVLVSACFILAVVRIVVAGGRKNMIWMFWDVQSHKFLIVAAVSCFRLAFCMFRFVSVKLISAAFFWQLSGNLGDWTSIHDDIL